MHIDLRQNICFCLPFGFIQNNLNGFFGSRFPEQSWIKLNR